MEERPDWEVINFDKLTYAGIRENLAQYENNGRYHFIQGDIADRAAVEAAMDDSIDGSDSFRGGIPLSIAASSTQRRSWSPTCWERRCCSMSRALEKLTGSLMSRRTKFMDRWAPKVSSPKKRRLIRAALTRQGKAGGDLLVLAAHETHGDPVVITRCSNNYGPYQFPEKLIPLMVIKATAQESLPVYGDGMNVRDWIHVEDHARGVLAAFEKGRNGEVYNFGARNEWANIDLVKKILEIVERSEDLITYVTDRPGHDRRYAIDPVKAETELEWKPRYNFEDGLRSTVEWYQQNTEWWMPLLSGDFKKFAEKWYANRSIIFMTTYQSKSF